MSCYPTNINLPIDKTFENLINRNYNGYTFKETVENHLIKCDESIKNSIIFCDDRINEAETVETINYWNEVLEKVKRVKIEPHDCNIDYDLFMIKDMPISDIVIKYSHLTIGDVKKAKS